MIAASGENISHLKLRAGSLKVAIIYGQRECVGWRSRGSSWQGGWSAERWSRPRLIGTDVAGTVEAFRGLFPCAPSVFSVLSCAIHLTYCIKLELIQLNIL